MHYICTQIQGTENVQPIHVFSKIKKKIRHFSSDKDSRTIVKNSFSLLVIQGTNFLLPLIVLPYLIKTIGLERFGLVSFAQAFMSYFIIFIDFGYNLLTTREISLVRDDKKAVSRIVSTVLITKSILTVIAFIILFTVVSLIPALSVNALLYYVSFFLVLGQSFMPPWFFQGIEKMKYLTYVNFFSKVIFTVMIFFLITKKEEYIYVTFFLSLGNIVSSIIALYIMKKKFGVEYLFPKSYSLKKELANGWHIFLSNFSTTAYINSNLVILAFFASPIIVGYYSIADKVLYALRQVLIVFFQAIYPQVCKQALEGPGQLKTFFKKYFPALLTIMFLLCLLLFLCADLIVLLAIGHAEPTISLLLRLVSFVPVIISLNIPACQTFLAYDFKKSYSFILFSGSVLNILLNVVLASYFGATGTVTAVICTEIYITAGLSLILKYRHKEYSLI
jgi:PST family polysaccharide transporter